MKSNGTEVLLVHSKSPPTVEIDTEASAAYVRFKRAKVAKTVRHTSKWPIITIDLDSQGEVIGVEFVGVKKFNLNYLLRLTPVKTSSRSAAQASYVSAEVASH